MKRAYVVGAGAWGTALATVMAENVQEVFLWAQTQDFLRLINIHHVHDRLPGIVLSSHIFSTDVKEKVAEASLVLFATPAQSLRTAVTVFKPYISSSQKIVCASKGIENGSLALMSDILKEAFPQNTIAILSGPNFAIEVARKKPTATTIASANEADWALYRDVFETSFFHPTFTTDVIGAELGGALKNVVAIGCGILKGLGYEENTLTAFITNAYQEVVAVGAKMGARPETFLGLSGMGDLMLTCLGHKSRNLAFGQAISQTRDIQTLMEANQETVEGIPTTRSLQALAVRYELHIPLLKSLYDILFNHKPLESLLKILDRSYGAQ